MKTYFFRITNTNIYIDLKFERAFKNVLDANLTYVL